MLPGQPKVELYAALRPRLPRWHVEPGVAVQVRRHLEHVNKALTSAWPQPRTTTASARPSKLDPFTPLIDEHSSSEALR